MSAVYRLQGVVKSRSAEGAGFRLVAERVEISAGEKVALVGESGCGKSTLLDLLAMVLRPTTGGTFQFAPPGGPPVDVAAVWLRGARDRLADLRKRHLGYVLQTGGLLPYLSVADNIGLSRRLLGLPADGTVEFLASRLGIERQLRKLPGLLSAGERQRVAIARALAHRPSIVIADEPTASLDPVTARKIMGLFLELAEGLGTTLILASHDWEQVRASGLRRLTLRSRDAGGVTESVFSD